MARGVQESSHSGCRCRYKMRWFYSKGALLVLGWCLLENIAAYSTVKTFREITQHYPYWYTLIPMFIAGLGLLFSGWLADKKFGNYKIAKLGLNLMLIGALIVNIYLLFLNFPFINKHTEYIISIIIYFVASSLFFFGMSTFALMSLQLGLDQMPDASSLSTTSFIAWFVFSIYAGSWLSKIFADLYWSCIDHHDLDANNLLQVWSFLSVLFISIVLISDYLLAKKWLILEPNSQQSLKLIFLVLKFAAKHKAPLNRSALTYWEEDIPSRLDLGKRKYGGPFTTEQVEDVKTILRLLLLGNSLLLIAFSYFLHPTKAYNVSNSCGLMVLPQFTYDARWCSVVSLIIYEFTIYPIMKPKISIMKKIGILSLLMAILSLVFLVVELINNYLSADQIIISKIMGISLSISFGVLSPFLVCAIVELVLAQAPYNIRGLMASYAIVFVLSSIVLQENFAKYLAKYCSGSCNPDLIVLSVKLAISLFGFLLYCLLAQWYKRRVRDDVYSPHRVVEEVYDRYLTAAEISQVPYQH